MTTLNSNENNNPDLYNKYQQGSLSYVGNDIYYAGTDFVVEIGKDDAYADDGTLTFTGNNIYAPNALYEVDGVSMSLSAFNTLVGGTNTEVIQAWSDPVNGDFSTGTPVHDFNASTPTYLSIEDTTASTAYYEHGSQMLVTFTFNTTSTGNDQRFIDGAASGGYSASYAQCGILSDDTIYMNVKVVSITVDGGSALTDGDDFSAYLDGNDHTAEILVQTGGRVGVIGIAANGSGGFDGLLWGVQFVQVSDSSVLYDFPLDTQLLDGETDTDSNVTITMNGAVSGDWTTR
jgi:hypothetical protein